MARISRTVKYWIYYLLRDSFDKQPMLLWLQGSDRKPKAFIFLIKISWSRNVQDGIIRVGGTRCEMYTSMTHLSLVSFQSSNQQKSGKAAF